MRLCPKAVGSFPRRGRLGGFRGFRGLQGVRLRRIRTITRSRSKYLRGDEISVLLILEAKNGVNLIILLKVGLIIGLDIVLNIILDLTEALHGQGTILDKTLAELETTAMPLSSFV